MVSTKTSFHTSPSSDESAACASKYDKQIKQMIKESDEKFNEVFRCAQEAILEGVQPQLIPEGSSGSYFVYNKDGETIGVFKPKDEEPFAALNPKWPKFFQRVLCFCCFGRACLIPNTGYLSEAGASIVDEMFHFNVIPKTRVVKLASPSFFYSRCCGRTEIRPKEGSFQLFVKGYESAAAVFARWNYDSSLLSKEQESKFLFMFQKMCILDYVIRNTDRHPDNLLIKHIPGGDLEIAVIDNGLAFPVKHPECTSLFRTFPFRWGTMDWAKADWDEDLRTAVLQQLTPIFVHELCLQLKKLFCHGYGNTRLLVNSQLRVVRGQLWNLRDALQNREPPAKLAQRQPIVVTRTYRRGFPTTDDWEQWFRIKNVDYGTRQCC
ncbi:unnamed protein product [Caenorhabditis auriculariae]|uniref:Phosphatidylinositol 4-kinase type 2 n=1 Tax=Caenorhabditis auriculariae TaxID=2777116 RepID=A0A8S1HTZ2_9PELO|nr:unnamed protein product [Caenorhabditis auriculariae]